VGALRILTNAKENNSLKFFVHPSHLIIVNLIRAFIPLNECLRRRLALLQDGKFHSQCSLQGIWLRHLSISLPHMLAGVSGYYLNGNDLTDQ
jgi:hypothetical protein